MQNKAYKTAFRGSFLLLLLGLFVGQAAGQTVFVGPANGDWFTAANWSNGLPAAGNDATIPGPASVTISAPLVVDFGVQSFGGLAISANLTVNSGKTLANSGAMSVTAGTVTNAGTLQNFGSTTFSGAAIFVNQAGASFQNSGPFALPTTLTNAGQIINNGTIDATGGTILSSGSFDNNQTFTTKTLTVASGSSYLNNFGATLNITGVGASFDASGTVTNNGTINNAGLFSIKNVFTNNVAINNNAGGEMTIFAGAQLNNGGTLTNKNVFTNNGTFNNNNNFYNEAAFTNNSQLTNNNRIENRPGGNFINNVSANIDNGFGTVLLNQATFSNKNSIATFGLFQNDATFTNDGSLTTNSGSTFDNNSSFVNNGTLNTNNTARNDGTFSNNGVLNVNSGSVFTNYLTFNNNSAGRVNVLFELVNASAATLTNNGRINNLVRIYLEGQTTNNGYVENQGDVYVRVGGTLTNKEVISQLAGNMDVKGQFINQKTFLNDDCSTLANRAGGSINNTGLIKNRGIVIQQGSLTGQITSDNGFLTTSVNSFEPALCKNSTISADVNGIVKVYATGLIAASNTDSCQNIIYRANGIARPTFACSDIGTIQNVNVYLKTRLGDSLSCVSQVTPTDILAPEFSGCPADITIFTAGATATATWTAPTAVDNCSAVNLTTNFQPGAAFPVGITAVNYVATDARGNAQTCQFKVSVVKIAASTGTCTGDVAGPTFSNCPTNQNLTTTGQFAVATWAAPTVADGCQPITLTSNGFSGKAFPIGVSTVTYTARDGNGNASTCSFLVTVAAANNCSPDNQKPSIFNCPANVFLQPNATTNTAVALWQAPGAGDNCVLTAFSSNFQPGSIFPAGATTVVYTASDASGNSATCAFSVTVGADPCPGDAAGPTFSGCPTNQNLTTSGTTATATWTAPTAADPCGGVTVNSNFLPGAAFPIGSTEVIYTASDRKGNASTCRFLINVATACSQDAVPPVIAGCPANITLPTTGTGATATWAVPTATDNCQLVSFSSSYQPGAFFPNGTTLVTYTALDMKGNISNCSFNVVVQTAPGCAVQTAPTAGATGLPINPTLTWDLVSGATGYDVLLGTTNPPTTVVAANLTVPSYQASGLAYNTQYFWIARPKNAIGNAASCAASSFRTLAPPACTALSAPANAASGLSPAAVSLTWVAAATATAYDVFVGTTNPPTVKVGSDVAATSFSATNLTNATTYFWFVTPKNAAGAASGCHSAVRSFSTGNLPVCATQTAPANNSAGQIGTSTTFSWNAVAGATGYDLFLGTTNPPTLLEAQNLTATTFSKNNLTLATTYFWYVQPKNGLGTAQNCATTNVQQFTTGQVPACAAPSAPANGSTGVAPATVALTWQAISNATSYDVFFGTSATPTVLAGTATTNSFSVQNLASNVQYFWRIVPKNAFGSAAGCSISAFTTANPAPAPICKGAAGTGLTVQTWTGVGGTALTNLTSLASYPNSPNSTSLLAASKSVWHAADNYGTRVRGFITPAQSGSYVFFLTGDDQAELYLGTSADPATKQRIANIDGWTSEFEYYKYPSQKAAAINLVTGQDYFVEVLQKEGSGGDGWGIFWCPPGVTAPVQIPLLHLSPIGTNCGAGPAQVSCSGNLLINNGFENNFSNITWVDDASIVTGASNVSTGSKAAQVCNVDGGLGYQLPITVGSAYSFSAKAKISGTPTCAGVGLQYLDANWAIIPGYDIWVNVTATSSFGSHSISLGAAPSNAKYVQPYVWKCGTTGCLTTDDWCLTAAAAPTCNKNALFLVDNTTLNAADLAIRNRLQSLGLTVTTKTDVASTTADATGKGLIVISSSILSDNVAAKFTSVAVPILNYEAWLMDDLKMTSTLESTDYGIFTEYRVNTLAPQHPIGGGLSGWRNVLSVSQSMTWGKPSAAATKIAEIPNQPGKNAIFCYETGAAMVGMNAPARRVGFFLRDGAASSLTVDGWKFFDNSVKWAMNCWTLNNLAASTLAENAVLNAYPDGNKVALKGLARSSAAGAAAFVIEKSADEIDWFELKTIDAAGESYLATEDLTPFDGDNFYRLRAIFDDGSELLTEVQKVEFRLRSAFEIFPNPAQKSAFVNLKSLEGRAVSLQLFDATGRLSKSWSLDSAPFDPLELDLEGLQNGQFILKIVSPDRRPETRKIIVSTLD